jgi:hypothetical protein
MDKIFNRSTPVLLILVAVTNFLFYPLAIAQENKGKTEKLCEEIAGDYIFSIQGQKSIITFLSKEGSLVAYDQDDGEEVRLEPVDLDELEFETVNSESDYFFLKFYRDEKGIISRVVISMNEIEIEGEKIK